MAPLRAGVVGVGHLGRHHARLWAEIDGVDLVGVVDHDADRAAAIASEHGGEVFRDVATFAGSVDLASVAVPTVAHEEVASALLDRGVAVLVEKPIAPDLDAGRRMARRAAERNVPLMVGHTERFHPAIGALLERVRRPRFVEIHRLAPFKPRSLDIDVLLDLMIHDLDLTRVIFGRRPVERFEASGTPALTSRTDIASVRLRFEGGAAANLTASRISVDPVRRIRVIEPGAYFTCDTARGTLHVLRPDPGGPPPQVAAEAVEIPPGEPLRRELEAFRDAVNGLAPVPCTAEDGLAALELALGIGERIEADLERFERDGG